MNHADDLAEAIDAMLSASIIPRRSTDRIRDALREGRTVEPHLTDIDDGMREIADIYDRVELDVCPACRGTGHANGDER